MNYYFKILKQELLVFPQLLKYIFSSKKKAIYVGCTGMGNLGDEAIFNAIRYYFSDNVFLHEIRYDKPNAGSRLRKLLINNPDFIILGGGTIIKKGPEESYLKIITSQKKLYPKAKIVIVGPGVANADFAKSNGDIVDTKSWSNFLNESHFVSVRGLQSVSQLQSWGVEKPIHIFHDPALFYARGEIKPKSKTKKIGVNFAFIGNKIYGKNPALVEKFAKKLVGLLIENCWNIYLYPTTKSDLSYMQDVIGLKEYKNITIYEDYISMDKSLNFIESMDVFIGQRLHSMIFAACTYTPFHTIEYEPKASDFLLTTGFEGYSTKTDELDVKKVFDIINNLYSNIEQEQVKSFKLVRLAKKEQKNCVDNILKN